jgi:hypothetical protein
MTTEDDDLTGQLRQLFADARLDLPPRPDAERAVVAGARRRRRRRIAAATAGGALAAALLVGGSLAVADLRLGTPQATVPAAGQPVFVPSPSASPSPRALPAPSTQAVAPTEETRVPAPDESPGTERSLGPRTPVSAESPRGAQATGAVVGPGGYSRLRLGMSFEAAKATGMLAGTASPPSGCATYQLSEGSASVSGVVISPTEGIVRFQVSGAHTPEGIRVGSTVAQLQSSYADLARSSSGYTASAGSAGTYVFVVTESGTVTSFQLTMASTC